MQHIKNQFRGSGMETLSEIIPAPSTDAGAVAKLLAHCPAHTQTPLVSASDLAFKLGIANLHIKDERARMGLGSFKALVQPM